MDKHEIQKIKHALYDIKLYNDSPCLYEYEDCEECPNNEYCDLSSVAAKALLLIHDLEEQIIQGEKKIRELKEIKTDKLKNKLKKVVKGQLRIVSNYDDAIKKCREQVKNIENLEFSIFKSHSEKLLVAEDIRRIEANRLCEVCIFYNNNDLDLICSKCAGRNIDTGHFIWRGFTIKKEE